MFLPPGKSCLQSVAASAVLCCTRD